jgi:putative thioredoxin
MTPSPHVFDVTEAEFAAKVVEASRHAPVLVDFWAAWCGPCQMLMPVLARLAEEYGGKFLLAKVDTDRERGLASTYGIRSIPNVKVFKDGEVVDEMLGAQPESDIRALIDRYIVRESDALRSAAAAAMGSGETAQAVELLERAAHDDPQNPKVTVDLAKVLLQCGEIERAQQLLDSLSRPAREEPEATALAAVLDFARIAQNAPDTQALEQALAATPGDLESRYQLSARKVMAAEYEAALEQLLEIIRRDRGFRDDAGRRGMLAIFELLGGKGDLVSRYRNRMFNALH